MPHSVVNSCPVSSSRTPHVFFPYPSFIPQNLLTFVVHPQVYTSSSPPSSPATAANSSAPPTPTSPPLSPPALYQQYDPKTIPRTLSISPTFHAHQHLWDGMAWGHISPGLRHLRFCSAWTRHSPPAYPALRRALILLERCRLLVGFPRRNIGGLWRIDVRRRGPRRKRLGRVEYYLLNSSTIILSSLQFYYIIRWRERH